MSNHQGAMTIPIIPASVPPDLKLIFLGHKLEKALEGAITLAAIFVLNVAIIIKIWATMTTTGFLNLAIKDTGSQGASSAIKTSLKLMTDAQVTKMPTNEYSIMVNGSPKNCPVI